MAATAWPRRGKGGVHGRGAEAYGWDQLGTEVHLDDTPRVLTYYPAEMVPVLLHTAYNETLERCAKGRPIEDWLAFERLLASEGAVPR